MSGLIPVILAGGSGTRLWPLSRKNYPKQFLQLKGEDSLLQQTVARCASLPMEEMLVVCNDQHYFLCKEQLDSVKHSIGYLLEPIAKNTAPALACSAYYLRSQLGGDALMLALPSDHWLSESKQWQQKIEQASFFAKTHRILMTFGIKPTEPKTGYGYIKQGDLIEADIFTVDGFYEKPDSSRAQNFLEAGDYLWNSGMLLSQVDVLIEAIEKYAPEIAFAAKAAVEKRHHQFDYYRLDADSLANCPSESIDYAVMEKADNIAIMPLSLHWSDLGCWSSVFQAQTIDENGNAFKGDVLVEDSHDCLINSENGLVAALGLSDQVIVSTKDVVLVADKRYSERVKEMVAKLSAKQKHLAEDHLIVKRPWGHFEILAEGALFKVKRLMVNPGAHLSLQMHQHRAEHWVVVQGEAEVINGDHQKILKTNQSTYIPPKTKHRLSNTTKMPLCIIEVQSGEYLGEDDIQRFDDVYQRAHK